MSETSVWRFQGHREYLVLYILHSYFRISDANLTFAGERQTPFENGNFADSCEKDSIMRLVSLSLTQ